jgi:hypothetical protein
LQQRAILPVFSFYYVAILYIEIRRSGSIVLENRGKTSLKFDGVFRENTAGFRIGMENE